MARPHTRKWKDPLVPIDHASLCQAIERAGGTSRRALAAALARRLQPDDTPTPQTLDYLCSGKQKRCRASLRSALAEELDTDELFLSGEAARLGVTIDQIGPGPGFGQAGRLSREWAEMVFSLKLPVAIQSAMFDLPGAVGQASLLLGLIELDETGGPQADIQIRRASLRDLEAWHTWLKGVIDIKGAAKAGAALAKALPHIRERFSRVPRYAAAYLRKRAAKRSG